MCEPEPPASLHRKVRPTRLSNIVPVPLHRTHVATLEGELLGYAGAPHLKMEMIAWDAKNTQVPES